MKYAWLTLLAVAVACRAEAADWSTYVDLEGQLFPSYIIATATIKVPDEEAEEGAEETESNVLGDPDSLIGILITDAEAGSTVRVTVKGNSIMEASTFETEIPEEGGDFYVMPKINYKYDALHRLRQQIPLNIAIEVSIDGEPATEQVQTVTLRSINDCPFVELDPATEEIIDMSWMFGAYVNENHPQIDQILREALDTEIVNAFVGYQANDPESVYMQVFAIWNVLQRRGFKYSNVTATPGASDQVGSQFVRFIDQSLKTSQANCVDGSVLIASVLRKIGLNVHLVLVPGHCFLAFDLDPEGSEYVGLETTMMGQDSLRKYDKIKGVTPEKADEMKNDASWETFSAAIDVGTETLEENVDKFADEAELDYVNVSIDESRQLGIMPIAYVE